MNLLIITSSGGGGLLQAAIAKEHEVVAENPYIRIVKRDVLKDWIGKWFGAFCIALWNSAQRRGDVRSQKFFVYSQWLFDYISWPNVFIHTLRTLFKEDIDRVIDTQNLCTSAIVKAIRIFNRRRSKQIFLEKVLVDLPTKKATHYFRSIKGLSREDKKYVHLKTVAPLLEEGETTEQFWQKNCGLSEREIHYEDVNVRRAFRNLQGKPRSQNDKKLTIRFKNQEELFLMQKSFSRGKIQSTVNGDELHFLIHPQDRVITVLLGSQPASNSTFNYVKNFIRFAKESKEKKPTHLFVFCADHKEGSLSLFRKVADFIAGLQDYPTHFSVIPFSFQSDDVIAPLFHASDITCSRSGGQTAMELMAVSTGEIWIHSEAKKNGRELSLKELLDGIPGWESESALYMQKMQGAKIVTPDTFNTIYHK